MYIYNVTINIDESVHDKWLNWMKDIHIPEMLKIGKFSKALMSQVLVNKDLGGVTYSVQYTCDSKETLERYYLEDAQKMREKGEKLFKNKFGAFRTEMKVIKEYI